MTKRKIVGGVIVGLSSLVLLASLIGVVAALIYRAPLIRQTSARLDEVETQLTQIQTDLQKAKAEVDRALRIIQSAEDSLAALTQQAGGAKEALDEINAALDDNLMPKLEDTRAKLTAVRETLQSLREALKQLNSIPFVNFNVPGDEIIVNLLGGVDSLDAQIGDVQDIARRASTFIGDASYLIGGDFQTSKENLRDLSNVLTGYDEKIGGWLDQTRGLKMSAPLWINRAAFLLTAFLLWTAFSQLGLILHGRTLWRGEALRWRE
ncbi:MAG: hypothetical protein LC099_02810 [Anaerolineales bacterium]|nr:hypothetical protein [Anaerolineales bacterium]